MHVTVSLWLSPSGITYSVELESGPDLVICAPDFVSGPGTLSITSLVQSSRMGYLPRDLPTPAPLLGSPFFSCSCMRILSVEQRFCDRAAVICRL